MKFLRGVRGCTGALESFGKLEVLQNSGPKFFLRLG